MYRDFIGNIQIQDIFLSNVQSKRYVTSLSLPDEKVSVDFNPEFLLDHIEKDKFISKSKFGVKAKIKEKNLFDITCEFTIVNVVSDKDLMKEEFIRKYVNVNLPIIVWPYGREMINSITTRMGFPPLILGNRKNI